jgi:glycosyltransferase involved in cell wall biosynthesis
MKVLWLSNVPSPYRVDFFNRLGDKTDLTVLFEMDSATDRHENWASGAFKSFKGVVLKGFRTSADKALCFSILHWLKRTGYDIIIVSNYSTPTGMLAVHYLRLRGVPFVIQADGGFFKGGTGFKERLKRHLVSSASYWLSSGRKTTEYLMAYGAYSERVFEFPFSSVDQSDISGKNLEAGEKQLLRDELGIRGDKIAIAVGQFIYRKGFDVLIRAWSRMRTEYTLLIIGGGQLEQELNEMIRAYAPDNVRLLGFKDKKELYRYYLASDLFILPTREDIWGLVVNEAMACGLPVITTNKCIAGMELIEDNRNGFIVQTEDECQLYEKADYIMSRDEIREKMADNSLEIIGNYTIDKMVEAHENIFSEIVREK